MSDKEIEPMPTQDAGILSWVGSRAIQSFQPTPRPWRAAAVFFIVSGVLLTLFWLAGPYPITFFPEDTTHVLAHGDGMAKGLVPYSDYFSTLPFLPFVFSSLGIKLFGVSLKTIIFTQVVSAGLFGVLLFLVCSTRFSGFWAVACGLSAELLLLSATPPGYKTWRQFSYAMGYNSIGFILLAVTFTLMLIPRKKNTARGLLVDITFLGIALGLLLLTKITFLVVAVGVLLVAPLVWPSRYTLVRAVAAAALGYAVAFLLYASVNASLWAYVSYILSVPVRVPVASLSLRFLQYSRTISLFMVSYLIAIHLLSQSCGWKATLRVALLSAVAAGALLMAAATCTQDQETLPFLGIVPLSMAVIWGTSAGPAMRGAAAKALAAVLAVTILILVGTDAKNGAMSMVFCRLRPKTMTRHGQEVSEKTLDLLARQRLNDRVDLELFRQLPASFVDMDMVSALTLLNSAQCPDGDVLFVVHEVDSVTLLTNLRHSKGWNSWWWLDSFETPEKCPLPVENFLADTDWILRSKSHQSFWNYLMYHRGDYVRSHFKVVATNQHWQLYERQ